MRDGGFAHLIHNRHGGIERRCRALGYIGDTLAAEIAALQSRTGAKLSTVDRDGSVDDTAACTSVGHGGEADGGLASAGFADQPEYLASFQASIDAIHKDNPVDGFDLQPFEL